jgi:hypothetical protein
MRVLTLFDVAARKVTAATNHLYPAKMAVTGTKCSFVASDRPFVTSIQAVHVKNFCGTLTQCYPYRHTSNHCSDSPGRETVDPLLRAPRSSGLVFAFGIPEYRLRLADQVLGFVDGSV